MFAWRAFPARGDRSPGAYITMPALHSAGIRVAFTTRHGGVSDGAFGSLNLSYVSGDDPDAVRANRRAVVEALGGDPVHWTSGKQVHGARAAHVDRASAGAGSDAPTTTIADTDALWTDEPFIPIAVLTADCVPIVVADPAANRLAVVHAGWRGLLAGVVEAAVEAMGGGRVAAIGPSIGPCCYEVGEEVASQAGAALGGSVVRHDTGRPKAHLDLWRGAREALRRSGVREVGLTALCTRCEHQRFYSHRAGDTARQGVVAMIGEAS